MHLYLRVLVCVDVRVAASVGLLLTLGMDLPPHSLTASYGLAHILAALTVTNLELKTKGIIHFRSFKLNIYFDVEVKVILAFKYIC